uniref:Ovule protein n=1 Tax=Romanomermis culicivorax TaxID=13658 RepID=A0A915JQT4_ROMCU
MFHIDPTQKMTKVHEKLPCHNILDTCPLQYIFNKGMAYTSFKFCKFRFFRDPILSEQMGCNLF